MPTVPLKDETFGNVGSIVAMLEAEKLTVPVPVSAPLRAPPELPKTTLLVVLALATRLFVNVCPSMPKVPPFNVTVPVPSAELFPACNVPAVSVVPPL